MRVGGFTQEGAGCLWASWEMPVSGVSVPGHGLFPHLIGMRPKLDVPLGPACPEATE